MYLVWFFSLFHQPICRTPVSIESDGQQICSSAMFYLVYRQFDVMHTSTYLLFTISSSVAATVRHLGQHTPHTTTSVHRTQRTIFFPPIKNL